jgi:hypothetical protein
MRVNVYYEELTDEVEIIRVEPRPGASYIGLRFFLKSSPDLHNKEDDDDRSAVTLWVGSAGEGRNLLAQADDALRQYQYSDRDRGGQ